MLVACHIPIRQNTLGVGQGIPASQELDGIVQIQAGFLLGRQQVLQCHRHLPRFQCQDDDSVVRQPVTLNGLRKRHAVEDGTIDALIVH